MSSSPVSLPHRHGGEVKNTSIGGGVGIGIGSTTGSCISTTASTATAATTTTDDIARTTRRMNTVNVLCLGMSYSDCGRSRGGAGHVGTHDDPSSCGCCCANERMQQQQPCQECALSSETPPQSWTWRDAVKAVQEGRMSEMDGRDLARCLAVESLAVAGHDTTTTTISRSPVHSSNCEERDDEDRSNRSCSIIPSICVYTSSLEVGGTYRDDRHLHGNFCNRKWISSLLDKFPCTEFDQVVLDYFWIPPEWDESHWTQPFFERTLPDLCRHNLLRRRGNKDDDEGGGGTAEASTAVAVYLPFTVHTFRMVMAFRRVLLQHYDISFVRQHELDEVLLWKGTQLVDDVSMQNVLGKRMNQEDVYCRAESFIESIKRQEESKHIATHELLQFALQVPDVHEVRFLALRPVPDGTASGPNNPSKAQLHAPRRRSSKPPPGKIGGLLLNEQRAIVEADSGSAPDPSKRTLIVAAPALEQRQQQQATSGIPNALSVTDPRHADLPEERARIGESESDDRRKCNLEQAPEDWAAENATGARNNKIFTLVQLADKRKYDRERKAEYRRKKKELEAPPVKRKRRTKAGERSLEDRRKYGRERMAEYRRNKKALQPSPAKRQRRTKAGKSIEERRKYDRERKAEYRRNQKALAQQSNTSSSLERQRKYDRERKAESRRKKKALAQLSSCSG